MAMDPKLKREWVKALRSGEYEQASNAMCRWDKGKFSFCCLGVLVDIATDNEWTKGYDDVYGVSGVCGHGMPYEGFMESIGLSVDDAGELAAMNDNGKSFKQIALSIERRKNL